MAANPTNTAPFTYLRPEGWSDPEIVDDFIVADGLTIARAGVAIIAPSGEEITGSAAAPVWRSSQPPSSGISVTERSWFELLERASVLEAIAMKRAYCTLSKTGVGVGIHQHNEIFPESDEPTLWRYARSNGVALHSSWGLACQHAFYELVDRDRILGAWYGDLRPSRIELDAQTPLNDMKGTYEWRAYAFDEPDASYARDVDVTGVFGFPKHDAAPLVYGFAARSTQVAALDAAQTEAIQLLAFLWGEPIGTDAELPVGTVARPTPGDHLDHYQPYSRHQILRRWLDDGHRSHGGIRARHDERQRVFVDITPRWLSKAGLFVAKALAPAARPLAFGDSPFVRHLPAALRIHPIP